MSLENFQLIDDTSIQTSIIKRDSMKLYHHQGGQLSNSNQGIDFIFGENGNCHQIGNAYLEFDTMLRKNGNDFNTLDGVGNINEPIRLVINDFAYASSIATLSTTAGEEMEVNIYCGLVSTIMRSLTNKDQDLLLDFVKVDGS